MPNSIATADRKTLEVVKYLLEGLMAGNRTMNNRTIWKSQIHLNISKTNNILVNEHAS